ncbi:hypothetical protein [Allokutzneria oryzae]|uniref:Uncharacterized protein n=1 Tax=Allokutzneria oryzae TaxID=1378989 RepID=A0ABV5ZU99_9PSEU
MTGGRRPVELWAVLACLLGSELVFLVTGLVRWAAEGGADLVTLPLLLAVLAAVATGGILARLGIGRIGAITVAIFAALLHLLVVLGDGPVFARIVSGVVAAAQVYAVVLLSTGPMRKFLEGR